MIAAAIINIVSRVIWRGRGPAPGWLPLRSLHHPGQVEAQGLLGMWRIQIGLCLFIVPPLPW